MAKHLKLIGCLRGGPVNIDMEHRSSKGIQVTKHTRQKRPGVAEYHHRPDLAHLRNIVTGSRHFPKDVSGLYYYK
jgi:phosphoglycerate dehydrogenase-like enzyme